MVDTPEEGVANNKTLLECLREVSQRIFGYISKTTKAYVVHILGLAKSFCPKDNVSPLADGMAADCSKDNVAEYLEEVSPVA
jgi:hypothetical protein